MAAEEAKWYILHTYSGYENKVATGIMMMVENRNIGDLICDVRIPMEKVKEIRNNEEVEIERKLFPGYVLIKMVVNDDTWILIKGIRGVTGFVGPEGKPVALTEEELANIGIKRDTVEVPYAVGDMIRVTDGSMKGFTGTVSGIDLQAGKAKVIVSVFGREVPVELPITQLEMLNI